MVVGVLKVRGLADEIVVKWVNKECPARGKFVSYSKSKIR